MSVTASSHPVHRHWPFRVRVGARSCQWQGKRGLAAVADPVLPRPASAIYGRHWSVLRESAK
jgi:hypothetical protein